MQEQILPYKRKSREKKKIVRVPTQFFWGLNYHKNLTYAFYILHDFSFKE